MDKTSKTKLAIGHANCPEKALKIKEEDRENIKIEIDRNNIYPTAVFKIIKNGKEEEYELIE